METLGYRTKMGRLMIMMQNSNRINAPFFLRFVFVKVKYLKKYYNWCFTHPHFCPFSPDNVFTSYFPFWPLSQL